MPARTDEQTQEIERIMRRAAELGQDPERVAVALGYYKQRIEYQVVEQLQPRSWYQRLFAGRVSRTPQRARRTDPPS
jgi:hypothetical protein